MDDHSIGESVDAALIRRAVYSFFSKSFQYPTRDVVTTITHLMKDQVVRDAAGDEFGNVRRFLQNADVVDTLEAEYNRLFAHLGSTQCPPYETEYGYNNVFQKAEAMADIAGFYSAFGLEVGSTKTERVDFLSTECEFMSHLICHEAYAKERGESEHREVSTDAQRKFVRDHLGRWVVMFSQILLNTTTNPLYLWLGLGIREFIEDECSLLGVTPARVAAPRDSTLVDPQPFDCTSCATNIHPTEQKKWGKGFHSDP